MTIRPTRCLSFLAALLLVSASGLFAQTSALNYPLVTPPPENPSTPAKEALGKILFWDEQLSSDNTMACGTCHIPAAGGSDPRSLMSNSTHPGPNGVLGDFDDVVGSRGVIRAMNGGSMVDDGTFFPDVQRTGRKTPSMIDAAFFTDLFWDGRARSQFVDPETGTVAIAAGGALESQAVGPPVSDVEMAHENRNWAQIVDKISKVKPLRLATNIPADMAATLVGVSSYGDLFTAAFGDPTVTVKRIAFAIGAYERTLIADQTPFDTGTLTPQQMAGLQIFNNVNLSRCTLCHSGPLFSDDQFHNIGMADPAFDVGRMAVTGFATDLGRMKTPSLRNVGLRNQGSGNLFHNGNFLGADLGQVLGMYILGSGPFTNNLDPLMAPVFLSAGQQLALIEFLQNGLTDPRVANETGPFTRPTLRSETGVGLPVIIPNGFADSTDSVPNIIAKQPANLQHPFFTIGVSGAWGGMDAYLIAGSPNTLGETLFGFIPLGVGSGPLLPFIHQITLNGTQGVHGTGYGSVTTGIANNPFWAGLQFFAQWIVTDPIPLTDPSTGNLIPGLGVALSDTAFFTVLP